MISIPPPLPGDPDALRADAKALVAIAEDLRAMAKKARGLGDVEMPALSFRRLVRNAENDGRNLASLVAAQAGPLAAYADRVESSIERHDAAVAAARAAERRAND